jgi:hypothetical protein
MVRGTVADEGLLCAVAQKCLEHLSSEAAYLKGPSNLLISYFLAFLCVLLHRISQTALSKQWELCDSSRHAMEINDPMLAGTPGSLDIKIRPHYRD